MASVDVLGVSLDLIGTQDLAPVEGMEVGTRAVRLHHDVRDRALSGLDDLGESWGCVFAHVLGDRLVEELDERGAVGRPHDHETGATVVRQCHHDVVEVVDVVGVPTGGFDLAASVLPAHLEPVLGVVDVARDGKGDGEERTGCVDDPAEVGELAHDRRMARTSSPLLIVLRPSMSSSWALSYRSALVQSSYAAGCPSESGSTARVASSSSAFAAYPAASAVRSPCARAWPTVSLPARRPVVAVRSAAERA